MFVLSLHHQTKTKIMKNQQTVYIVSDGQKLFILQYAPTQSYAGQKDSDSYSLAQGLKFKKLSHDLWLNDVLDCEMVYSAPWGLESKPSKVTILAKKTFNWNMSAKIGQREEDAKETKSFRILLTQLRANK